MNEFVFRQVRDTHGISPRYHLPRDKVHPKPLWQEAICWQKSFSLQSDYNCLFAYSIFLTSMRTYSRHSANLGWSIKMSFKLNYP